MLAAIARHRVTPFPLGSLPLLLDRAFVALGAVSDHLDALTLSDLLAISPQQSPGERWLAVVIAGRLPAGHRSFG